MENRALRAELARVREERDILKKRRAGKAEGTSGAGNGRAILSEVPRPAASASKP